MISLLLYLECASERIAKICQCWTMSYEIWWLACFLDARQSQTATTVIAQGHDSDYSSVLFAEQSLQIASKLCTALLSMGLLEYRIPLRPTCYIQLHYRRTAERLRATIKVERKLSALQIPLIARLIAAANHNFGGTPICSSELMYFVKCLSVKFQFQ